MRKLKFMHLMFILPICYIVYLYAQVPPPPCPPYIVVECAPAYCPTLRPCYPQGIPPVNGICCLQVDDFGCCQYTSRQAARPCVCQDDQGIWRYCVDRYGYINWTGYCVRDWAFPDPTFDCCVEGRLKGHCEYTNYPCN